MPSHVRSTTALISGRHSASPSFISWLLPSIAGLLAVGCAESSGPEPPPEVVSTTPRDGARGISVVPTIEIEFSRAMETDRGRVFLEPGGSLLATDGTWSDGDTRFAVTLVEPLPAESPIQVEVDSFVAAEDGARLESAFRFGFETGLDDDPPDVASSRPRDMQMDVDPDGLEEVLISFDEDMDTTVTNVPVTIGDADPRSIPGRWDDRGRTFVVEARVLDLPFFREVLFDVTVFADVAGNAVPMDAAGGDGVVSFVTGPNAAIPFIQGATPEEGAGRVSSDLAEISVVFSEQMDTSITGFELVRSDGETLALTGRYEEDDLVLVLPVPEPLDIGFAFGLDLRVARDLNGDSIGDDEPYTGDGILDFRTVPPTGDTCETALRPIHGDTVDGVTTFLLPAGDGGDDDQISEIGGGTGSCSPIAPGPDAVIIYEKTTESYSDGGSLLRVTAAIDPPDAIGNVALEVVASGDCAPAARLAPEQLTCQFGDDVQRFLDVGPGTYHIFVAGTSSLLPFPGAKVTVAELDDPTTFEGESCAAPYTVDSPNHTNAGPNVDRWTIDSDDVRGTDMAPTWGIGSGALSCVDSFIYGDRPGADTVIEIDKADPDSLLRVVVTGSTFVDFEVLTSGCDATVADRSAIHCGSGSLTGAVFEGGIGVSGPLYIWLASSFPDFGFVDSTVEVEEIAPVAPGEACGQGLPLAAGDNPVSATATNRRQPSVCFAPTDDILWFQYEMTENAAVFTPEGTDIISLRDGESGEELVCGRPATTSFAAIREAGHEICLGVASGAGTTNIRVEDVDYRGPGAGGRSSVTLITDGSPIPTPQWLAVAENDAYLGDFFGEVTEIDLATGATILHDDSEGLGSGVARQAGVVANGLPFSVGTAASAEGARLYRLWDGTATAWDPEPWDGDDPVYSFGATEDLVWDGTDFLMLMFTTPVEIYAVPGDGGNPVRRAGNLPLVGGADTFDVDGTYAYFADSPGRLFRVPRSELMNPVVEETPLPFFGTLAFTPEVAVDGEADDARYLFYRASSPAGVHVIELPPAGDPRYLGLLAATRSTNLGLDYDHERDRLVIHSTFEGGSSAPQLIVLDAPE